MANDTSVPLHNPHIAVLGAGAWVTALASVFSQNHALVQIWAHVADTVAATHRQRDNTPFLPDPLLP